MGVPQYRFLETFQSRALANQFPNRLSPTLWGTLDIKTFSQLRILLEDGIADHLVFSLFSTSSSTMGVTLMNQAGMAR
jgi:hypothetical protein